MFYNSKLNILNHYLIVGHQSYESRENLRGDKLKKHGVV